MIGLRPRLAFAIGAIASFILFCALGTWQLERRVWKLALIARVEHRVHAAVATAPGPAQWAAVNAIDDEYRHVQATGTWLPDASTRVQAVTELGAGFWVLTPLQQADGSVLLVNRGFVPPEAPGRGADRPPTGLVTVTGLLRMTEPGGAFLRRNDPDAGRWYSRDVQAIAATQRLPHAAPYFVDADAAPAGSPPGQPVGGLTVIAFHNNHLVYALTWYALAAMAAWGGWRLAREAQAADHD